MRRKHTDRCEFRILDSIGYIQNVERIFRRVCFKSFTFHHFFFIRSPSWPGTHMEMGCTHVQSHKCKRIEKWTDILQQKPFSMYVQFVCMLAFATRHETWTGVRRYRENCLNIFLNLHKFICEQIFISIYLWFGNPIKITFQFAIDTELHAYIRLLLVFYIKYSTDSRNTNTFTT